MSFWRYIKFIKLVYKFEDYNKILYNWHKDESKYDGIVALWKSNTCIFKLFGLSDEEKDKELENLGLSYRFRIEIQFLLRNTIESKTEGFIDFIKSKFSFFYSIIRFSTNEENQLMDNPEKDNNSKTLSSNLLI